MIEKRGNYRQLGHPGKDAVQGKVPGNGGVQEDPVVGPQVVCLENQPRV